MPRGSAVQLAIDSRRAKVAELYLQGYRSQRAIAEKLANVSRQTVATDLQAVRKWWKADAIKDIGQAIVEELAKIDRVEQQAWEAWERSKGTREKQRTAKSTRDDSTSSMAQIEKEDQYGDPRFLEKVCWCIERRCKLIGLEPPSKHQHSGNDGNPIEINTTIDVSKFGSDQLRDLERILAPAYSESRNGQG